jgi:hypothetical protein
LLKEHFGFLDTRFFIEQVASAPTQDVQAMSKAIGCRPTEFDASRVSWNDRRRLYWYDWSDDWPEEASVRFTRDRRTVSWEPVRPACSQWLQQGSSWPGRRAGARCSLSCGGILGEPRVLALTAWTNVQSMSSQGGASITTLPRRINLWTLTAS